MKRNRRNSNEFKFYNSKLDMKFSNKPLVIDILKLYPKIEKEFGNDFLAKVKSKTFSALNLQRLGLIEKILTQFYACPGFNNLLGDMKKVTKKILETEIEEVLFKEYESQLHRYFSELFIPYYFIQLRSNINEFHPKDTGINGKSCDCSIKINGTVIHLEITTINVENKETLRLKIGEIFEEKAQKQTIINPSILAIDITSSAQEKYDDRNNRFKVFFPIFEDMVGYITEELKKEENKHLVGVLVACNILCESDRGDFELIFDYSFKLNQNNSYYSIITEFLDDNVVNSSAEKKT